MYDLIIFDTNALLDLYTLSKEHAEAIIDFFKKTGSSLYIPEQVSIEFSRNHHAAKSNTGTRNQINLFNKEFNVQKSKIETAISSIKKNNLYKSFETEITKLTEKLSTQFDEYCVGIEKEIESMEGQADYDYETHDPIFDFVNYIIITNKYKKSSQKKKIDMSIIADQRIKLGLKPGLTDTKKSTDQFSKYADIFIWFDIIETSSSYKNVIFIENERKSDWWDEPGSRCAKSILVDWDDRYGDSKKFTMKSLVDYLSENSDYIDGETLLQLRKQKENLNDDINKLIMLDDSTLERVLEWSYNLEDLIIGEQLEYGNISDIYDPEPSVNKDPIILKENAKSDYSSWDKSLIIDTHARFYYEADIQVSFDKDSISNSYRVEIEITLPVELTYAILFQEKINYELINIEIEYRKTEVSFEIIKDYQQEHDDEYYSDDFPEFD